MLKINFKIKNEKGIILITSYLVITVLLTFSLIFVNRSVNEQNIARRQRDLAATFYLAEAGLARGLNWLRNQAQPPAGTAAFDPLAGAQDLGAGTYTISIDPDDANPGNNLKRYKIISNAAIGGVTEQLVNEVQTDSYARYAYFTDTEHFRWFGWFRVPVWFIGGDTIEGTTQSNSHFHIRHNPGFTGLVRSADNFTTFYNNGNPIDSANPSNPDIDVPDFQQGLDLGVDPLNMPSRALDLRVAAVQAGLHLNGSTTVVLNADGTMNVTNSQQGWDDENMPLPGNGALFVTGGNLTVSGTLDGRLTMGTNRDVIVANSITYSDDPRDNPPQDPSDDMLGLIAERDVVISQDAPDNVTVEASIMALGDSFTVEDWWGGDPKDTLTVYGGIIQNERGPVGTFNPITGERTGYLKDYNHDPRLLIEPPPFYPTTGDYISLSWEE
ncbi:MAG: hypothetical protein KKH29_04345 [Candidatus Omnitrophica bacterium]|nr:hypothetical protein [Candidatus Omnitrophota bacterium]MCG2706401.1 hypothetical protein [Candidatus Omnitrophota bacterium]